MVSDMRVPMSIIAIVALCDCKSKPRTDAKLDVEAPMAVQTEIVPLGSNVTHAGTLDSPDPSVPVSGAPDMDITAASSIEGWVDLTFFISSDQRASDGGRILRGSGRYKSTPVELAVKLGQDWKQAESITGTSWVGEVHVLNDSRATGTLLKALAELYAVPVAGWTKRDSTFAGLSLSGEPATLQAGPTNMKLFFHASKDEDYAELYLNIDVAARRMELREKSPDYRSAILRALGAKR
jgi:hypothetical protein